LGSFRQVRIVPVAQGIKALLVVGAYCPERFVLSAKLSNGFALGGKFNKYCRGMEFHHFNHDITLIYNFLKTIKKSKVVTRKIQKWLS